MSHLLLEKAFTFSPSNTCDNLDNYEYDEKKGYWFNKISKIPLIIDFNSLRPRTKKQDVETGEDVKGE